MPYTSSQLCPVYSNNANFLANERYCSLTCYILIPGAQFIKIRKKFKETYCLLQ